MAAALVVLLAGCGTDGGSSGGTVVLAKAEGWRDALSTDESMGAYFAVVEVAYDEATARAAWGDAVPTGLAERDGEPRDFGRYGNPGDVDFEHQVLVVYSSGQSGACPGWPADIDLEGATVEITEGRHVPGDGCTDDYNAYRVVLAVDRARLPAESQLPTEQVLVDGRELTVLVAAYPAR